MKRLAGPLLLLFAVPTTAAEPSPTLQYDTILHTASGFSVLEQIEYLAVNGSQYDGVAHFWTPANVPNLTVSMILQDGARRSIEFARIQKGAPDGAGLQLWRVDLTGALAPGFNATAYSVLARYETAGADKLSLRTYYTPTIHAVFVTPPGGQEPVSATFANLTLIRYGTYHDAHIQTPANTTYEFEFRPATGPARTAATKNQNQFVWAGGGLLLGWALFWLAARQGWVSAPAKAKKFVKGGQMESRPMLEARRRTLLAALKELEQAHDSKEIPDDAYAPLKEEYKAQAVRVMRSIEEKSQGS